MEQKTCVCVCTCALTHLWEIHVHCTILNNWPCPSLKFSFWELCSSKSLSHISEAIFIAVWQSLLSAHEYVTSPPDFRLILTEIVNNYIIGITFLRAFNSVETFVLFSFSSPLPMTVNSGLHLEACFLSTDVV